ERPGARRPLPPIRRAGTRRSRRGGGGLAGGVAVSRGGRFARLIGPLGICFLAWQIVVPAVVLPRQGLRRFGWQMFATAYSNPVVLRQTAAGTDTLPLREVIAYLRADMELGEGAGRQLC